LVAREPILQQLVADVVLKHNTFKDALFFKIATTLGGFLITVDDWIRIFNEANSFTGPSKELPDLELLATMDLQAIKDNDPSCESLLTAFLNYQGFKALQTHRAAHSLWLVGRKDLAVSIQGRSSEVFGVDIHPAAVIHGGIMLEHASGVVIGETAVIGRNCTILHGVTLGSSGKDRGDRHPKIGDDVKIGCNAIILGNISIGNECNIGAGSIVLKPLPPGVIAVGNTARVISAEDLNQLGAIEDTNLSSSFYTGGTYYHDWSI